ncbi:uncharacterized, partial [Tachysurus ichikawai]
VRILNVLHRDQIISRRLMSPLQCHLCDQSPSFITHRSGVTSIFKPPVRLLIFSSLASRPSPLVLCPAPFVPRLSSLASRPSPLVPRLSSLASCPSSLASHPSLLVFTFNSEVKKLLLNILLILFLLPASYRPDAQI